MALDKATLLERSKISKKIGVATNRLESWELVRVSTEEINGRDVKKLINWKYDFRIFLNYR